MTAADKRRHRIWNEADTAAAVTWFDAMLDETIHTECSDRDRIDRLECDYATLDARVRKLEGKK